MKGRNLIFRNVIFVLCLVFVPTVSFCSISCSEQSDEASCNTLSGNGCQWNGSACTLACNNPNIDGFTLNGDYLVQTNSDCMESGSISYYCSDDKKWHQHTTNYSLNTTNKCYTETISDSYFANKIVFQKCNTDGKYYSGSECKECEAGYYCSNGERKQCDAGTYSSRTASSICTKCQAGTYSGKGAASCTSCDAGTYSDKTGAVSCTQCEVGTYSKEAGASSCKPCEKGTYNNKKGQSSCGVCNPGTYTDATGQTKCKDCEVGNFCPGDYRISGDDFINALIKSNIIIVDTSGEKIYTHGAMLACPEGYMQSQSNASTCDKCPANKKNEGTGNKSCDDPVFNNLTFNPGDWEWPSSVTVDNHIYNYSVINTKTEQ